MTKLIRSCLIRIHAVQIGILTRSPHSSFLPSFFAYKVPKGYICSSVGACWLTENCHDLLKRENTEVEHRQTKITWKRNDLLWLDRRISYPAWTAGCILRSKCFLHPWVRAEDRTKKIIWRAEAERYRCWGCSWDGERSGEQGNTCWAIP